jgi:hypothetical protein
MCRWSAIKSTIGMRVFLLDIKRVFGPGIGSLFFASSQLWQPLRFIPVILKSEFAL